MNRVKADEAKVRIVFSSTLTFEGQFKGRVWG